MTRARAALALLLALAGCAARAEPDSFAARPEVQAFIQLLVERHAFSESELQAVFSRARREEGVLTAVQTTPVALARSWEDYRATFVNERLVKNGLGFWREHRTQLERVRRTYGVPEEIVVAILGVETFYGRNTGRWRVIDSLSTLAFDYPPRAPFFRGELENYLLFAREMDVDVFALKGSYAGAIGIPQFMPTSYLRYAVDFDGDGVSDLSRNAADAIGSVGNFLKQHGWRRGELVQRGARVNGDGHGAYADGNPLPRHSLEELAQAGVEARGAALPAGTRAVLLELRSPDKPAEYRLGLQNFYVLTRYNRSVFYAMAVSDLADTLRATRHRPKPGSK
jgi:membrane-bound lytic murein transglycosylase B